MNIIYLPDASVSAPKVPNAKRTGASEKASVLFAA